MYLSTVRACHTVLPACRARPAFLNPTTLAPHQTTLTEQVPSANRKQLRQLLALPGINVNVRGPNGHKTPIMLAVERGQPGILSDLLATGRVDLAARDSSGATAVLLAARSADAAVLRILLDAGAGAGGGCGWGWGGAVDGVG